MYWTEITTFVRFLLHLALLQVEVVFVPQAMLTGSRHARMGMRARQKMDGGGKTSWYGPDHLMYWLN